MTIRIAPPMGFLTEINERVRDRMEASPLDEGTLLRRATMMPPVRDLASALRRPEGGLSVIAEVKRSSPSSGSISEGADAVEVARRYTSGGAAAISVLTEAEHFSGSLLDLHAVRSLVDLPVLRKDFIVHPAQLIETRAHGADAVLLIVASLSASELTSMLAVAKDLGLGVLLESHSDEPVIGVNARDLETLEVDFEAALQRLRRVPGQRVSVLESGVDGPLRARAARVAGATAVLVGEALMRSLDPGELIGSIKGVSG
jgi:indole-3-glycerol phosphate synthase